MRERAPCSRRGERRVVTSNACGGTRDRTTPSEPPDAPAPLELTRDLGWLLTMLSALGALVGGSWLHFPQDSVGMWAGYWVTGCSTVAILGCIFLRTSQPTALGVAATAIPARCSSCWERCATTRRASA